MSDELTLDKLVAAIREGHTLGYLRRMVGPGEEEQAAAESRVAQMDAMWKAHGIDFDLWPYEAQQRYESLCAQQDIFESMYL